MKRINAARMGETVIEFEFDGSEGLGLGGGFLGYKQVSRHGAYLLMWLSRGGDKPIQLACVNKGGCYWESGYCHRRDFGKVLRIIAVAGGFENHIWRKHGKNRD